MTAVFNLAGMYLTNDKSKAAIVLLQDYTKKYPGDAGLYARLGDAYFGSKQLDKAIVNYKQAVEYGCDDYMTKPIDFGQLKEKVLQ